MTLCTPPAAMLMQIWYNRAGFSNKHIRYVERAWLIDRVVIQSWQRHSQPALLPGNRYICIYIFLMNVLIYIQTEIMNWTTLKSRVSNFQVRVESQVFYIFFQIKSQVIKTATRVDSIQVTVTRVPISAHCAIAYWVMLHTRHLMSTSPGQVRSH